MGKRRGREWHQFPTDNIGWFDEERQCFCDRTSPDYRRNMRMISWRRP